MGWLRLGIRGRIYAGFGGLLALGLVLAGIALWALFSIDREVTRMDATSDHAAVLRDDSEEHHRLVRAGEANRKTRGQCHSRSLENGSLTASS